MVMELISAFTLRRISVEKKALAVIKSGIFA
jgi:hypothetical protein